MFTEKNNPLLTIDGRRRVVTSEIPPRRLDVTSKKKGQGQSRSKEQLASFLSYLELNFNAIGLINDHWGKYRGRAERFGASHDGGGVHGGVDHDDGGEGVPATICRP